MKRKLNKRQKLLRTLLLLALLALIYLFLTGSQGYLTADQAHDASEMTLNYGPSQVAEVVRAGNVRYYLGRYDRWFSCHPVYWTLTGWRFGSQSLCDEIDPVKAVNHSWFLSNGQGRIWGVVNDPEIVAVEAELSNSQDTIFLRQNQLYRDNMFLLLYQADSAGEDYILRTIRGYDRDGSLIYTESL